MGTVAAVPKAFLRYAHPCTTGLPLAAELIKMDSDCQFWGYSEERGERRGRDRERERVEERKKNRDGWGGFKLEKYVLQCSTACKSNGVMKTAES